MKIEGRFNSLFFVVFMPSRIMVETATNFVGNKTIEDPSDETKPHYF